MNKNFKKFISIFVITVFVLMGLSGTVFADFSYENNSPANSPWTGNNVPHATMANSDGTKAVLKANSNKGWPAVSVQMPVLASTSNIYGKTSDDLLYHTYDLTGRSTLDEASSYGFFAATPAAKQDAVLSFSFAYKNAGAANPYNSTYTQGTLMQSYLRYYSYDLTSEAKHYNALFLRTDGVWMQPKHTTDKTSFYNNKNLFKYSFEPNKWYTVDFVFDFENKSTSDDPDLQSQYKWCVYVNGTKIGETTVDSSYYSWRYLRWFPAFGADMYWDNLVSYNIEDAATFKPGIASAELSSSNSAVVVDADTIKIDSLNATAGEVKAAVQASLKTGETLRIYNSDYTQELDADSAALGAKLVVAGSTTLYNETTARENVYTYYDVVAGKAAFDEPSVTTDASAGKASGSVNMLNYTGEAQSFKGYLAVYNGTELVSLGVDDFEAEADQTEVTFSIADVPFAAGNTAKFFVWKADGITPEIASK